MGVVAIYPRLYLLLLVIVALLSTIAFGAALVADVYAPLFLMGAFVWVPISLAVFWVCGAVVRTIRSLAGSPVRRRSVSESLPRLFLWLVASGCLSYLTTLGCSDPSQVWWGMACTNNLRQIGLALHRYHQKYDCFPPAYIVDENGKPMHSWRVLILPFMDHQDLCDRYDFNEPWNGQENRKLVDIQPREYICPADQYAIRHQDCPTGRTSYLAVVGAKAPWRGSQPVKFTDLRDGVSNTILVIEFANSDVEWTEPRDLPWDEIARMVDGSSEMTISAKHWRPLGFFWHDSPGYTLSALFADGSGCNIAAWNLSPELLKATFTVGGGGYKAEDFEGGLAPDTGLNWWNCSILLIWTVSVYLLLRRLCQPSEGGKRKEEKGIKTSSQA